LSKNGEFDKGRDKGCDPDWESGFAALWGPALSLQASRASVIAEDCLDFHNETSRLEKRFQSQLPETLDGWLTQRARQPGRCRPAIVREALERQRSKPGQATCLDLVQDVCGSVGGPRDLSFNPGLPEGLGK
jgi:hypothetical protein